MGFDARQYNFGGVLPKPVDAKLLLRIVHGDVTVHRENEDKIHSRMLKGLLLGIVLGVLAMAAGVYFYFSSGRAPVATAAAPMPFERKFAKIGLQAYLARLPHPDAPVPADDVNLAAGARTYREHCAVCHGLPGQPPTAIAAGMYPKPPELLQGKGVTDDDAWESYWKIENGIRMTGMPAFKGRLTETEIWQVSVLVKNADKLPPSAASALSAGPPPAGK